jgi:hypothetical protein
LFFIFFRKKDIIDRFTLIAGEDVQLFRPCPGFVETCSDLFFFGPRVKEASLKGTLGMMNTLIGSNWGGSKWMGHSMENPSMDDNQESPISGNLQFPLCVF